MGAWGSGPFDNDSAADFLADARGAPAQAFEAALRRAIATTDYLDVDDGSAVVAAAEVIALGFGFGKLDAVSDDIRRLAAALGPNDGLRTLALAALPRVLDTSTSELAQLWDDGADDEDEDGEPSFAAVMRDLVARLEAA